MQIWDEARLGINALEMMRTGHLLVPTFHLQPDLWNPKPPLATWAAALSMRLFGINEVALRLPSILAAIATTFAAYLFTRAVSRSCSAGVLASMLLLGMGGYVEVHVARTADPDCFLVLFLTVASVALFYASGSESRRWYLVAASAFSAAMLSKGAAAFLMVPAWLLALGATGRLGRVVRNPSAWLAAAACGVVALLYCGAVAAEHPGFLTAAWNLDVAGRLARASENFTGPFYYYPRLLVWPWQVSVLRGLRDILYSASAFPWSLAALLLFPVVLSSADGEPRRAAIFVSSTLVGFIAVLTAAATKLPHYVAPAYPLIAILVALEVQQLVKRLSGAWLGKAIVPAAWVAAIVCMEFVVAKNQQENASAAGSRDGRLPWFVRQVFPQLPRGRPVLVVSDARWGAQPIRKGKLLPDAPYDGATEFYLDAARLRGVDARLVDRNFRPVKGAVVIYCGQPIGPEGHIVLRGGGCAAIAT